MSHRQLKYGVIVGWALMVVAMSTACSVKHETIKAPAGAVLFCQENPEHVRCARSN